jgi:hypothetical protein
LIFSLKMKWFWKAENKSNNSHIYIYWFLVCS